MQTYFIGILGQLDIWFVIKQYDAKNFGYQKLRSTNVLIQVSYWQSCTSRHLSRHRAVPGHQILWRAITQTLYLKPDAPTNLWVDYNLRKTFCFPAVKNLFHCFFKCWKYYINNQSLNFATINRYSQKLLSFSYRDLLNRNSVLPLTTKL